MKYMWSIILICGFMGLCGCEQALFPKGLPRTQYERFDRLRGKYVPPAQMTATGMEAPALRERISPYYN